jgi:hypothetical protein
MTRRSKREIERAVEDLDGERDEEDRLEVVIQRNRVDEDGEIVERNETIVEL